HLERMVGFVEQLREIDVEGVDPMTHATAEAVTLRSDVASMECLGRSALTASAGYGDGLVRVPRVVE
ncbi:MAG: Asp-tRNA(Asn)/Glu-tRNA(Gln) amidotransferase subunit GatC, partial [Myxococcota bacterium]